jgi:hypothetical protein
MLSQRYSGDVWLRRVSDRNLRFLKADPGPYICDRLVLGPPAVAFNSRGLSMLPAKYSRAESPLKTAVIACTRAAASPLSQILTNLARYRGFFVRITSLL